MVRCRPVLRLGAVTALVLLAGCGEAPRGEAPATFFVIGHRGAPREAAENTVPSLLKALELGADGIETDVCITRDDHLVLWHDAEPNEAVSMLRQANLEGLPHTPTNPDVGSTWRRPVRDLTLEELRTHFGYQPGEWTIPTVPEALAALAERSHGALRILFFDIKDASRAAHIYRRLTEALAAEPRLEHVRVLALSPSEEGVAAMRAEAQSMSQPRIGIVRDNLGDIEPENPSTEARIVSMGPAVVSLWGDFLDLVSAAVRARDEGRYEAVFVWTFDDAESLRGLIELGVDGIMTDDPALLRRLAGEARAARNAGPTPAERGVGDAPTGR